MNRKRILVVILAVLLLLSVIGVTDLARVYYFEKPVFARLVESMDDGGSGLYRGIGYSIRLQGNFLPEDEFPGVTRYEYRVFGILISAGIRD